MNFDNLVEDAEKHGASVSDSFSLHMVGKVGILFYEDELKALITQYILADRAASGEAVAWIHKNDECVCYVDFSPKSVTHTASTEPLYTRAQLWSERRPDSFVRVEQVEKIWDNGKKPAFNIDNILRDEPKE